MSFTNVFGGSTVQAAQVAYRAIALSASVALAWPQISVSPTTVLARVMDVTPSGAGFSITLPPANAASIGFDFLVTNRGAQSYTLLDNAGGTVATVAPGEVRYVYLVDNTTTAGAWSVILFGAAAASVNAASLQGYGVLAIGATLNAARPVVAYSANHTVTVSERAVVIVWTGGAGTLTLPSAATVGTAFFFEVRNAGTGALTVQPAGGETIDGAASVTLNVAESGVVHSNDSNAWYTVGRGRNQQFSFTQLVKTVTGGTVTLTQTEAANVVQKYTGTLTSNCSIVVPSVVQVYYVQNSTSGAFTLTIKTAGVGSTVTVPTGQAAVLFCDGTNVINASTTVSGISSLSLQQGTVTSPSLSWVSDASTGLYSPSTGSTAVAASGANVATFSGAGLALNGGLTFSSVGARISGDFSNAALTSRTSMQSLTTNGPTSVGVLPNGTANYAGMAAYNASNPTNSAFCEIGIDATIARLNSGVAGTGTQLPLAFQIGSIEKARISPAGNLLLGTTTDGGFRLQVVSAVNAGVSISDGTVNGFITPSSSLTHSFAIGSSSNHPLGLWTNNTQRVIVDATGAVSIPYAGTGAALALASSGSAGSLTITDTGANGAGISLYGNGATTPNKFIRAQGGSLQIVNSAYGAVPFTLTDTGGLTITGPLAASGSSSMASGGGSAALALSAVGAGQNTLMLTDTGANGVGFGLYGNGAVTPNKFIRVLGGELQAVNSSNTAIILHLTDAGGLSVTGTIYSTAVGTVGLGGNVATGIYSDLNNLAVRSIDSVVGHGIYLQSVNGSNTYARFLQGNNYLDQPTGINGSAWTPRVGLTYAAALVLNCGVSNAFSLTLTGNVTSWSISNNQDGQTVNIKFTQDATGSRTMAWPAAFKWAGGSAPALSTAANAVDFLSATYMADTGFWYASLLKGMA